MINKFNFFMLLVLLVSCNNQKTADVTLLNSDTIKEVVKDNYRIVSRYNPNGELHGVCEYYFHPDNVIYKTIEYKNGVMDGVNFIYRKDGTLLGKVNYMDGVRNGWNYVYFDDGKTIRQKSHFIGDKLVGGVYDYYSNGKLKEYTAYDFEEQPFYEVKWDTLGIRYDEGGEIFRRDINLLMPDSIELLRTMSPVVLQHCLALPPNTSTEIKMGILGDSLEIIEQDTSTIYTVTYTHLFEKTGKYKVVTIGKLFSEDNVQISMDSITTEVEIR